MKHRDEWTKMVQRRTERRELGFKKVLDAGFVPVYTKGAPAGLGSREAPTGHISASEKPAGRAPTKYRSIRENGYASRKESRRASELAALERAGSISNLREQVRFVLFPSQRNEQGKVIERPWTYTADFCYLDTATGQQVTEDCKGMRTPEYVHARKAMLYLHKIRIRET